MTTTLEREPARTRHLRQPGAGRRDRETLSHPKYRADIDGLRAVAVVAVVAFHASPLWVTGGFVGVDIFFVISGFLISTIIFENLNAGRFSFRTFYARRIRRIFPALLIVLAATLALGWLCLFSAEYWQLTRHAAAGAAFVANYAFWAESGYFDDAAVTKPLLHLWSLGIEEQFYIFWPLLALLAWKNRLRFLWFAAAIACASLALNLLQYRSDGAAAFYSIQTRAWELSLGSILAAFAINPLGTGGRLVSRPNLWSAIGFILIVVSIFSFSKDMPYPGWAALLPTAGAALLIAAGPEAVFNRLLLANRAAVWIGLISYPLYLWHWPLLSIAWIVEAKDPPRSVRFGIVFLSVALAWLTYRFVEKPIRRGASNNFAVGLASAVGLVGAVSLFISLDRPGWLPNKHNEVVIAAGEVGSPPFLGYYNEHFFPCATGSSDLDRSTDRCIRSHKDRPVDLAIVGDSHAQHLFPGLAEALPNANIAYLGIVEFLGPRSKLPSTQNPEFATIYKFIREQASIKSVLISAFWYVRLQFQDALSLQNDLDATAAELNRQGKKLYLAGDIPFFDLTAAGCKYIRIFGPRNSCEEDRRLFYEHYKKWLPALLSVAGKNNNVEILDLAPIFCWDESCHMVKDNVLLYRDSTHLNILGSRLVGQTIVRDHLRMAKAVSGDGADQP